MYHNYINMISTVGTIYSHSWTVTAYGARHITDGQTERKERGYMIVLDYRDRRPLYEQVTEKLEELMFSGVLPPDSRLPSVRSMATELSINPNTIQRAYAELERQGYIYSVQGKGSFVADGRRLQAGIRKDWEEQFNTAIEEGLRIGVSCRDMIKMLEEKKGGKADDQGNEPDKEI